MQKVGIFCGEVVVDALSAHRSVFSQKAAGFYGTALIYRSRRKRLLGV